MTEYATIEDVKALYRDLTEEEEAKATALLPVVCARIRQYAKNVGRDFDAMIEGNEDLAVVAKSVTVDVVARTIQTPTSGAPLSQFSESGMGYSASGTFLVPGGGIFIKNAELRQLGIARPKYGMIDLCGGDSNGNS